MKYESICRKARIAWGLFKHFRNPFLILLARFGCVRLGYCAYEIHKDGSDYRMLIRPSSSAGGDLWVLCDVLIEETYKSVLSLLPLHPLRMMDIGANIGAFTVWMQQQRGVEEGFCFEPDLESASICQFNLAHNECGSVCLDKRAVGGVSREDEIWVDAARPARSSLFRREVGTNMRAQKIQVIALSEWLAEIPGNFDLLKMDCEGCEWEILEANAEVFTRFAILIVEVHRDLNGKHEVGEFASSLAKIGFTTVRWDGHANGLYIGTRRAEPSHTVIR